MCPVTGTTSGPKSSRILRSPVGCVCPALSEERCHCRMTRLTSQPFSPKDVLASFDVVLDFGSFSLIGALSASRRRPNIRAYLAASFVHS